MGKRLAASNRKKRELKAQKQKSEASQYYGIGVVIAVGVIGGLGYYIYQTKKGEVPNSPPNQPSLPGGPQPKTNKFEMD